ncbi:MAG: glycosyltransferase family 2 protein [Candidatus Omnitrophota bacterium]
MTAPSVCVGGITVIGETGVISIVIVTFNSRSSIRLCLESAAGQGNRDCEIIVVDNGSSDDTVEIVRKISPGAKLIANQKNLGACRARNQGIEISAGEWVLTLDCDTVLSPGFFLNIRPILETLPKETGILQPKILRDDKRRIYSCGIYLSWWRRFYDIGRGRKDKAWIQGPEYIFGACSACALFSRRMLEDLKEDTGFFDERFFFLAEDVDLAWRARRKGWRCLFVPQAVCYHKGDSSGTNRRLRQYLSFRNRYYAIAKNEGIANYCRKVFPLICYDLPRLLYLLVTNHYLRNRIGWDS